MVEGTEQAKQATAQDEETKWTTIGLPVRVRALLDNVSTHHLKVYGKELSVAEAIIEMYKAWEEKIGRQA